MTNYFRALYYLYGLMKRTYWKQERLEDFQNRRLRRIVGYAFDKVPLYRKKFKEAGIKPAEIREAADLLKLPLVRKSDLRRNTSEILSTDVDAARLKMLRTSGSTGQPLHVYITTAEDEYRKAKHLRANISCGQRPRDKWMTITRHFEQAGRLQKLLGIYSPNPVSVFDDVSTQISKIRKLNPDLLDGYSNSLLLLAKKIKRVGTENITPRLLIGGAELIGEDSKKLIGEAFRAPFYDQYAIVELERVAWQCPEKSGYHIDADSVIVEFIDENGEHVAPGETGEIVCTSLFNYAMPFVRYRVGDLASAPESETCACGRTFPLMKMVKGRKGSLLLFPDGTALAPFAFIGAMIAFEFHDSIDMFRVIQRKEDILTVKVKLLDDHRVSAGIFEKELKRHLQDTLGIDTSTVSIEIEFVDDFSFDESGKFSIVTSELA